MDFYYIDKQYLDYMQNEDIKKRGFTRILNDNYDSHKKFLCGVVLMEHEERSIIMNTIETLKNYTIKVLVYDTYDESEKWITSRIEHNGTDYYIVGYYDINLTGLKVRIR